MARLLVVSSYSDQNFVSQDYTFVHHQTACLARHFDEITVVAPTPYLPAALAPLGRFWKHLRMRMLKRDFDYDNVRVRFARFKPWAGRIPGSNRPRGIWPAIVRTLRRHDVKYDLVHAHMAQQFGWHGLQAGRLQGVPSVLTVHDSHDGLMDVLRARRWDTIQALRESASLIRVNPFDIDEIREASGTDREFHYIPNGFEFTKVPTESQEALRRGLGLPLERPLLVSVARWIPRKDPLILLEGLARVKERVAGPPPLLCLVGEDLMEGEIQRRAESLGLANDLHMAGPVPPEDVLRYMRASDAVVLYSLSEGNPTVMFEALGCGRPYISSDVGGVRAVLVDERLGLTGPARDADALAALLERTLATEWDEDFISDHAQQYTWANIAKRIYDEAFVPALQSSAAASPTA